MNMAELQTLTYFQLGIRIHSKEAIAAEKNLDDTYSIAIKHTNTYGDNSNTDWEILTVNNSGVINFNKSIWTQSIQSYEASFWTRS